MSIKLHIQVDGGRYTFIYRRLYHPVLHERVCYTLTASQVLILQENIINHLVPLHLGNTSKKHGRIRNKTKKTSFNDPITGESQPFTGSNHPNNPDTMLWRRWGRNSGAHPHRMSDFPNILSGTHSQSEQASSAKSGSR